MICSRVYNAELRAESGRSTQDQDLGVKDFVYIFGIKNSPVYGNGYVVLGFAI